MKFVRYQKNEHARLGVLSREFIVDIEKAFQFTNIKYDSSECHDIAKLLTKDRLMRVREALSAVESHLPAKLDIFAADGLVQLLAGTKLGPPLPAPGKLLFTWVNYEAIDAVRSQPIFFSKFASCIVGPDDPVMIPAHVETAFEEPELAVVIGTEGKYIAEDAAMSHVGGYTIINDMTAYQFSLKAVLGRMGPYMMAKNFDTFAPMGPYVVTSDEVPDPHCLAVRNWLNGDLVQTASTEKMIFNIPKLISYLSQFFVLRPGDIISTGSSPSIRPKLDPPRYLKHGDVVRMEIERIGVLENPIQQERANTSIQRTLG